MATKIQASQISTSTSSWYSRLRTIQGKTPKTPHYSTKITQTTDPGITSGNSLTATSVNNFITALNALQSNTILSYASWSTYKPSAVTAGTLASQANVYTKINNMLTSLEALNSNYSTNSVYSNNDNAIYTNYYDYGDTCQVYQTNSTYGDNGTNTVNTINGEDCIKCSTNNDCYTYTARSNYDAWQNCSDNTINYVYDNVDYGTNSYDGEQAAGDGVCYDYYECWTQTVTDGCWADCCVGDDGDCYTTDSGSTDSCGDYSTYGNNSTWSVVSSDDCSENGDNTNDGEQHCAETTYGNNSDYDDCSIDGYSTKYGVYNCGRDSVDGYDGTSCGDDVNYSQDGYNTNNNTNSNYGEFGVT